MQSLFVLFVLLLSSILSGTTAADDARKFVSTDPRNTDRDFAYQGEYAGLILPDDGRAQPVYRKVGVQVIALGDGQFDAVVYQFGLPGDGWNRRDKERLSGHMDDSVLRLYGDQLMAEVSNGRMILKSLKGYSLGGFPRVIRTSPTLGKRAPAGATVLFDSTSADAFSKAKITDDGLLCEGADFRQTFTDFLLHVEFRLPYMPYARGQRRANSGVYLQSRYEVQILDSFGLDGAFNECGALYRYQPPEINMCLPPLQWQTYDIGFRSARFDSEGHKIANAEITVVHNGVTIHRNFEIERKTGAGKKESTEPFPIRLQNHGDPIRFRNIWIIDRSPKHSASGAATEVTARSNVRPR